MDTREEGDVDGDLEPSRRKRNADRNRRILWHDKIVPYKFDPGLPGENRLSQDIKHRRKSAFFNYLMCELCECFFGGGGGGGKARYLWVPLSLRTASL